MRSCHIDSQYALSLVASGRDIFAFCATVDPVIGLEEKECLPVNVEKCKKHTFLCCHAYLLLSFIFMAKCKWIITYICIV